MRIAIIGSGISGLMSAYLLHRLHDLQVFEAADVIGGHTHTVNVLEGENSIPVDMGFIVFNPERYPGLVHLFDTLKVASRPSEMSFGVKDEATGLEFAGTSLGSFFADKRRLMRPEHWRLLFEILRFQREGRRAAGHLDEDISLEDWSKGLGLHRSLIQHFLIPLGSSIWSAPPEELLSHPARFYLDFLNNHRMLHLFGRPTWRTVVGGSRSYLGPLTQGFADRIHCRTPITKVRRESDGVRIFGASDLGSFDEIIIAAHADQALRMVEAPTNLERELLERLPYQENEVILHSDASILPKRPAARASWNYRVSKAVQHRAQLTYDMRRLQGLPGPTEKLVTLNPEAGAIEPEQIQKRIVTGHPQSPVGAAAARKRHAELIRHQRISYCGAYFGSGFHEDGLQSAVRVAKAFGGQYP